MYTIVCLLRNFDKTMFGRFWRVLFFIWVTALLLGISWPWSKFDGIPHWENIHWVPFSHVRFNLALLRNFDIMANILAFIPLGFLLTRSFPRDSARFRDTLLPALVVGGLCSLGLEFYQLFCHERVPSTTDLLTNTGGTVLGAWAAFRIEKLMSSSFIRLRRLS